MGMHVHWSGIVKRFASSEEIEKREPTAWKSASTEAIRSPGRKRIIDVRVGQLILDIVARLNPISGRPSSLICADGGEHVSSFALCHRNPSPCTTIPSTPSTGRLFREASPCS